MLAFLIGWFTLKAQNANIDHWEIVAQHNSANMKFNMGEEQPPANWTELGFDESEWIDMPGFLIGYGGVFDYLGIDMGLSQTTTIYNRLTFDIVDSSVVEAMALNIYYADGFVAYLNGVEIARSNMGNPGEAVSYDQYADTTHANQGGYDFGTFYPGFRFNYELLKQHLVQGSNVLAIELHNDKYVPSAHNMVAWLMVGLSTDDRQYLDEEMWIPVPVDFKGSNLPIVKINTLDGLAVPNEPKAMAKLQVIFDPNAEFNSVSSTTYDYDGYAGIELRGSSTLYSPKKSYGLETRDEFGENNNVELLGMPVENDWILYASYIDKTLIRNVLTYDVSNKMGKYAPRTRYVELILNDSYVGTYVLMEKIKRDNDRIDISGLRADEIAGDSLTGGYIIKIDKKEGEYDGWRSEYGSAENESANIFYQYVYPKWDDIQEEQKMYIQNFVNTVERSLRADNFDDPEEGYRKYLNVESFIDYFIINEFTKNMDGYRLSTYMYKDRDDVDGKLYMGPVWDYNLALGNYAVAGFNGDDPEGWAIDFGKINRGDAYQLPFWWDRLLQDQTFVDQLKQRWDELRETTLHKDTVFKSIDEKVEYIKPSRERNFEIWTDMFEMFIWPNDPLADDYDGEIDYLKSWITDRLEWVDDSIGYKRDKKIYVSIDNEMFNEFVGVSAYPNPFIEYVNIELELEANHNVKVEIYNAIGQKVTELANNNFNRGTYSFKWDGYDNKGFILPSGVYVYNVTIDNVKTFNGKILKN